MILKLKDGRYIDTATKAIMYARPGNNGTWTVATDITPLSALILADNFQYKEDAVAAIDAFMADKGFFEIASVVTPPMTPEGALIPQSEEEDPKVVDPDSEIDEEDK